MFELFSTVLFGAVAVFFAIRLYSVLGRREGHMEAPASRDLDGANPSKPDASGHLRPAFEGPAAAGLEAIAQADQSFDPELFLDGARKAYEMIVMAFAKGDREALKGLLAPKVYDRYEAAIAQREVKGETVRTDIERIRKAEIIEAGHADHTATIKVHFDAEIATETLDADGKAIAGDFSRLATVHEDWVFERRTDTANPNWVLVRVATA
ncbi:Tim44/TimA family putative adaptor protein [Maricaulis alexandrii]|jgi:predicted lipid-binding transport protein (Tim44 family)|uniref:Tim44/TimA family putative adaptor protein n=1 Tax=Maricaulis alexandrii TaxID=2570354 RepID=UPI0011093217|nr:Tim44/TimA family putative adaptor protein [Maricaulis alexandrii]